MSTDLVMTIHEKLKGLPIDKSVLAEIEKLIAETIQQEWTVGFNDRGMGAGDYAVILGNTIIVKCPYLEIAEHIVATHNAAIR